MKKIRMMVTFTEISFLVKIIYFFISFSKWLLSLELDEKEKLTEFYSFFFFFFVFYLCWFSPTSFFFHFYFLFFFPFLYFWLTICWTLSLFLKSVLFPFLCFTFAVLHSSSCLSFIFIYNFPYTLYRFDWIMYSTLFSFILLSSISLLFCNRVHFWTLLPSTLCPPLPSSVSDSLFLSLYIRFFLPLSMYPFLSPFTLFPLSLIFFLFYLSQNRGHMLRIQLLV